MAEQGGAVEGATASPAEGTCSHFAWKLMGLLHCTVITSRVIAKQNDGYSDDDTDDDYDYDHLKIIMIKMMLLLLKNNAEDMMTMITIYHMTQSAAFLIHPPLRHIWGLLHKTFTREKLRLF